MSLGLYRIWTRFIWAQIRQKRLSPIKKSTPLLIHLENYKRFSRREFSLFRLNQIILSLSLAFPFTVSALSFSSNNKSKEKEDERKRKEIGLKLVLKNGKDKELFEDIVTADILYNSGEPFCYVEIYNLLQKHQEKQEPELLWRLARTTYDKAKKIKENSEEKKKLIHSAFDLVKRAIEIDDSNFAVHKWMAILLNEVSGLKGTKEQITQLENVKFHMLRAVELNPMDPTSVYLVGNWCYSVADVPWYQKKIAEAVFAKPPSSTWEEALNHFLKAEKIEPLFYSMNLLHIAKCYVKLNELEKAEDYLKMLFKMKLVTDEDFTALKEGGDLFRQIRKKRNMKYDDEEIEKLKS